MSPLKLTLLVEVNGGTPIMDAALDMVRLANALHCGVRSDFHGMSLIALPGDEAPEVVRRFQPSPSTPQEGR